MSAPSPSYRAALCAPGIARTLIPSLTGRLAVAMSGLALVLLLESRTGSFAVAGAVTALLGIANVVATPFRARLVDRFGQPRVLAPLGALHALALAGFAVVDATTVVLALLAIVAGVSGPPFGAAMRALWAEALPAGPLRVRGFSLDAVGEELTFTLGPLLAAAVVAAADPAVALLAAAALVAVGALAVATSPLARRRPQRDTAAAPSPRVRTPLCTQGFPALVVVLLAPGVVLGAVEIAAPALAADAGTPLLAGALLAVFAGASAAGGLVVGRLSLRSRLLSRLLVLGAVLAGATALLGLVDETVLLLVAFTAAGAFLAPTLITGYLAADELTDPRARVEASSWVNTAINLGAAAGAAVVGALLDAAAPTVALAATGLVVLLPVAAAALLRRVGRPV